MLCVCAYSYFVDCGVIFIVVFMASFDILRVLKKMSKRKRFEVGDVVECNNIECVVTKLDPLTVHQVSPGLNRDYVVNNVRPLNDWRSLLRPNDDVKYYFEGFWIHSHVHSVSPLVIQPLFTRLLIPVQPHEIRRTSTSVPHRFVLNEGPYDRMDQVMYDGEWYLVDKCIPLYVLTIDGHYLPMDDIDGTIPYSDSKIRVGTFSYSHGTEFSDSVSILESVTGPLRSCWRNARHFLWRRSVPNLDIIVSSAMDHFDEDRVSSLTFVSNHMELYEMSKWFEWRYCSIPYLKFEFRKDEVDVFWTGCIPISPYLMNNVVKPALEPLFSARAPLPLPLESKSSMLLDWQVPCVDRMSSLESVNVCGSFCDSINSSTFSHYGGFVFRDLPDVCGGVLCADGGLGKTWMMFDLYLRNPVRTLCVVPIGVMNHWKSIGARMGVSVSVWHGDAKSCSSSFVLTTCRTLMRGSPFVEFDRLILDDGHRVKHGSASMNYLRMLPAKIRWYVSSTPNFRGCCTFLRVFPFTADYPDVGGEIPQAVRLSRDVPIDLNKVSVSIRHPACWSDVKLSRSDLNVLRYDSSLLSPELLYDEISFGQDTLSNIESRVGRSVNISDKCAVCLEQVQSATVTPCGHVFCKDCSLKMLELGSSCPMCRGALTPLMEVSSKPSEMLLINGKMYGGRDLTPGDMKSKIVALNGSRTIFVTRSSKIAKDMAKYVHDVRLLRDCVGVYFDCDMLVFVDMYMSDGEEKCVLNRLIDPVNKHKVDIVRFN